MCGVMVLPGLPGDLTATPPAWFMQSWERAWARWIGGRGPCGTSWSGPD